MVAPAEVGLFVKKRKKFLPYFFCSKDKIEGQLYFEACESTVVWQDQLSSIVRGNRQHATTNFTMSFLQILQKMDCVDCPIEEKDQGRVWEQLYLILI